jgi:hypothetical protein
VSLAGDSGSSTPKPCHFQFASDPAGALMPWTSEPERQVRNRLFRAQQFSATRARQTGSAISRQLLWLLNETAAAHATAPETVEDLRDVADTLARLALVANGFERFGNDNG